MEKFDSKGFSSYKFRRKNSRPASVVKSRPKKIDDKKELEISCENANIDRAIIQTKSKFFEEIFFRLCVQYSNFQE